MNEYKVYTYDPYTGRRASHLLTARNLRDVVDEADTLRGIRLSNVKMRKNGRAASWDKRLTMHNDNPPVHEVAVYWRSY